MLVSEVSIYNHYLPQLLFSCISWEVHCENCGIPTMRVRGGTGLRWSLITLALLSATASTHWGLVRVINDSLINKQRQSARNINTEGGNAAYSNKQRETGQIHQSSVGDVFVKWVAQRGSWGMIGSDWPPTELRGKGGNRGVEWRRKMRGSEQGSVKERGWMDLLTRVFSYENKSIVTDGTLETS